MAILIFESVAFFWKSMNGSDIFFFWKVLHIIRLLFSYNFIDVWNTFSKYQVEYKIWKLMACHIFSWGNKFLYRGLVKGEPKKKINIFLSNLLQNFRSPFKVFFAQNDAVWKIWKFYLYLTNMKSCKFMSFKAIYKWNHGKKIAKINYG